MKVLYYIVKTAPLFMDMVLAHLVDDDGCEFLAIVEIDDGRILGAGYVLEEDIVIHCRLPCAAQGYYYLLQQLQQQSWRYSFHKRVL